MDKLYQIHICVLKRCIVQREQSLLLCVQMENGHLGRDQLLIQTVFHVNVENGAIFMIYLKIPLFRIGWHLVMVPLFLLILILLYSLYITEIVLMVIFA